jgi:type I restriction enzyme S subunit
MTPVKTVPLGDVATVERSSVHPVDIRPGTMYLGLEDIASGGAILSPRPVDPGDLASTKFSFTESHVLYGKLRPYLAKIAAPDFAGICSTDIVPVLPGPLVDRRYLLNFLRQPTMVALASARSVGINLPRLSPSVLETFPVPLPPLPDQRRIAAVLDKADELRAKRQSALTGLDLLARSIFLELFGDPVTNPHGWQENTVLDDVADIMSGITKGRRLGGAATREVPYLAVVNVQDRRLALNTVKTIEATEAEIRRYQLKLGDLLLTEGGDPDKLGRGSLWNEQISECIHQNHIFRVRLTHERITPLFLNWLIGSERGKRYFLKSAKQTTGIASINLRQLRAFPILTPPLTLQQRFATAIECVSAVKAEVQDALAALDGLFVSLQHRAFGGEL